MSKRPASAFTDDLLPADIERLPVAAKRPFWQSTASVNRQPSRRALMGSAWIALALFGSTLWWMLGWIQPASPIRLSLLGAGYETNLSVAHNAFGWGTLADLAKLAGSATNKEPVGAHWCTAETPCLLTRQTDWWADWENVQEPALMIYVSAHGSVDPDGPYLIAHDGSPNEPAARIRFSDMLARLSTLPAEVHKTLFLDVTHFEANPSYGCLNNDFPHALRSLDAAIALIPNLVVINSCDLGQRSHVSYIHRRTIFGHTVSEGLRGAAVDSNGDGRIDGVDFFQFVQSQVQTWSRNHRDVEQVPMLLPSGEEGRQRARRVDLRIAQVPYQPKELPQLDNAAVVSLQRVWSDYRKLKTMPTTFVTEAAGLSRAYAAALVRYEELVQAGDYASARLIEERLRNIQYQMEWEQTLFTVHNPGSLALAQASCHSEQQTDHTAEIAELSAELWKAQPAARGAIWDKALAQPLTQAMGIDSLRFALLNLAYERAAANPLQDLERAAEVARVVRDPLAPIPVEIHFLEMLALFLPADARGEADQHRLRRALEVKLMAERVAVSYNHSQPRQLAHEIKPWIAKAVTDADRSRRQAEDLLFAGASERVRADALFESADEQYRRIERLTAELTSAIELTYQALADTHNFSRWINSLTTHRGFGDAEVLVQRYEAMCQDAIALMDLIHSIPAQDQTADELNTLEAQLPTRFERLTDSYATLNADFQEWWRLQTTMGASDWLSLSNALHTTAGDCEQRLAIYEKICNGERAMELTAANVRTTSALTTSLSSNELPSRDLPPQEFQRVEVHRAAVRGRLAMAIIGEELFDVLARPPQAETYAQLQYRLSVLTATEAWRHSLQVAGAQIAQRLAQLPEFTSGQSSQNTSQVALAPSQLDQASLQLAQKIEWQYGGQRGELPNESPSLRRRSLLHSSLFAWLAERIESDHWASGSVAEPYYKEAAENYLQTATRLWPENPELAKLQQQLDTPEALQLVAPESIDLTTESEFAFDVAITSTSSTEPTQGYAILSTTSHGGALQLIEPPSGKKQVHELSHNAAASRESIRIANPQALVWLPFEPKSTGSQAPVFVSKDGPTLSESGNTASTEPSILVHCFFRGRTLERRIPLSMHDAPSLTSTTPIRPRMAQLAVRASKQLNAARGLGEGAIAFVLDASGSMGGLPGKAFDESTKYYQATRALEQVLSELPPGIQVSVWTFGQAMGPQKTVLRAEQTIRRVVPPQVWHGTDGGQLRAIMKTLQYPQVEPWNASPVVEAILAAKQDLTGITGFKSVVVITDGVDSRLSGPAATQRSPGDVSSTLKGAFDGTDIVLNVIGFRVEAQDEQAARTQFRATESFNPAGRYLESTHAEELADMLQSLLHQRIQYWLDDYSNAELPSGRRLLPVTDSAQDDSWHPGGLEPGTYNLWNTASARPTRVSVRGGDRLALELDQANGDIIANRRAYLSSEFSWKPSTRVNQWQLTALENRITGPRLELLLGLERLPTAAPSLIEQVEPFDLWFEVTPTGQVSDDPNLPTSLHWLRTYDYPVPSYRVSVQNWPRDTEQQPQSATCKVWFNPQRQTPAGLTIQRGKDFDELSQLAQRSWDLRGDALRFEEIQVEMRSVLTANGDVETQPCLLIRIAHAGQVPVRVQPTGLKFAGEQHLHYRSLGKTTAMFWPVSEEQLANVLDGFAFISPVDLKERAEEDGYHAELKLGPASTDDIVFPPLVRRSAYD